MLAQNQPSSRLPGEIRSFSDRYATFASPYLYSLAIAGLLLLAAPLAGASILSSTATSFTGDPLTVAIQIDDETDPGNLQITLSVVGEGDIGDLRGFFAHVSDESLLPGLSVTGDLVRGSFFDANDVINVGRGSNLNGGGSPCPCDLGIEIGNPGIGRGDDFQSVMLTLSHVSEDLTVALFRDQPFGIRVTSVGSIDGSREGSSKLIGVVPEPTTATLMLFGLGGLASVSRSRSGLGGGRR
jgi:hypothetical protein